MTPVNELLIRESKFTQMGIKCQCVIESEQMIGGNISSKPIIMSEKNDWFATLYVSGGMGCNGFAQMNVCDTL